MKQNRLAIAALLIAACLLLAYGCRKTSSSPAFTSYFSDTSANKGTGLDTTPNPNITFPFVEDLDSTKIQPLQRRTSVSRVELNVPPPGNQRVPVVLNNCVGWALGYGLFGYDYMMAKNLSGGYIGTENLFSPMFLWCQLNGGENVGIRLSDALFYAQGLGCCRWPYMPGDSGSYTAQPSNTAFLNASDYKLDNIYQFRAVDVGWMQFLLRNNYPLAIGIRIDRGFETGNDASTFVRQNDGRLVWTKIGTVVDHHVLLICGYDNSINAFKALNSWGSAWGNQGFCWIDYNLLKSILNPTDNGNPEIYWANLALTNSYFGTQPQGPFTNFTANAIPPYSLYLCVKNVAINLVLDNANQNVLSATVTHDFAASGIPANETFTDAYKNKGALSASINAGTVTVNFPQAYFVGTISGNTISGTYTDSASFTDLNSGYVTFPVILTAPVALDQQ